MRTQSMAVITLANGTTKWNQHAVLDQNNFSEYWQLQHNSSRIWAISETVKYFPFKLMCSNNKHNAPIEHHFAIYNS